MGWRGAAQGDADAQEIIAEKASLRRGLDWSGWAYTLATGISGIWYIDTGSRAAISLEIIMGVLAVCAAINAQLVRTHTFVMIAERRAQLLQQAVDELRSELSNERRRMSGDHS